MSAPPSPLYVEIHNKLVDFLRDEVEPANRVFFEHIEKQPKDGRFVVHPVLDQLKARAKQLGLFNLFLPKYYPESPGLTNLEYVQLAELMGRAGGIASEACNSSAPDTGNMEVLAKYGTADQKAQWLRPLLEGSIRSAFLMTEPEVASSDATNIRCSARREGDEYVLNGRKWWSSGACDPRCKIFIVMCRIQGNEHNPKHQQQSMILVPADSPGIKVLRALKVFGYDDAPEGHGEVLLDNVRVPLSNIILGEGRGFEIAQGRLGPGRLHHCARSIGAAEKAQELLIQRAKSRTTFGKKLIDHDTVREQIAENRIAIDQARLLVHFCAKSIDRDGDVRGALREM